VVTSEGPAAAIDDDPRTRWVSSPASVPTDQWITMTFSAPRPVHEVTIQPVVGDSALAPLRKVEVEAGASRQMLTMSPDGAAAVAHFDGRPSASVTVRVREVGTARKRAPVALATVRVDDLAPRATLRVPEPLRPDTDFLFHTAPGARPCVGTAFGPDCDETRRRSLEEPQGLDRTFGVEGHDTVALGGSVVARTSGRTLRLLEPVGREQRITASSVLGHDPHASSRFAWDGSEQTAWVPADSDAGPTLVFRWSRPRDISGLRVESPDIQTAPRRALVTTAEGEQLDVPLIGSTSSTFAHVRTRRLAVTFQRPAQGARLVIDEVELDGADITQPFDPDAATGAVCGLGPHIVVDDVVHQSKVEGTLADIVDGRPMRLTVCDVDEPGAAGPQVRLGAGEHRLRAPPTAQFQTVTVSGSSGSTSSTTAPRRVTTTSWHGVRRTATVGPGAETVVSMAANANPGWRATMAGKELRPLRVDGWQQGWILPAGSGGRLEIDFPLQHRYGMILVAGLVPAGCIVLTALVLLLRRRRPEDVSEPAAAAGRPPAALGLIGVLVLALGGACLLGGLAAWFGRRRAWPAVLAGLAVLGSGLLDARDPASPGNGVADLLAAVGFGILLVATVVGGQGEDQ
jgi:arabinofuranan 3-O-arabinosyltransferase